MKERLVCKILIVLMTVSTIINVVSMRQTSYEVKYEFTVYNEAGAQVGYGDGACQVTSAGGVVDERLLRHIEDAVNNECAEEGLSFDPARTRVAITAIVTTPSNTSNTPRP